MPHGTYELRFLEALISTVLIETAVLFLVVMCEKSPVRKATTEFRPCTHQ